MTSTLVVGSIQLFKHDLTRFVL